MAGLFHRTKHIDHLNTKPFEILTSKSSECKCFRYSTGRYSFPQFISIFFFFNPHSLVCFRVALTWCTLTPCLAMTSTTKSFLPAVSGSSERYIASPSYCTQHPLVLSVKNNRWVLEDSFNRETLNKWKDHIQWRLENGTLENRIHSKTELFIVLISNG